MVPISPQNAQWNVIKGANENIRTTNQINSCGIFQVAGTYAGFLEGRYDAFFDIKLSFEKSAVTDKDGSYHNMRTN